MEDLSLDRLEKIFEGVTVSDLSRNVSALMELLKCIMEDNDGYGIYLAHWRLSIRKVSTPENIKISDKHLLYIAERTIGLEELDLLGSSRITGAGFAKANMQLEKCQIC
ncbi:hypothetical protein ACOSQ4_031072 [Xanthoceras sorbifolium]